MLPEAYQDGAKVHGQSKGTGRIVWKGYLKVENRRNANLQLNQNQNGEWYPKSGKVLWRNEGSLSTQHRETWLQLEDSQGKEGGKSREPWGTQEKRVSFEQSVSQFEETIWKGRSEIQIDQQRFNNQLQKNQQTVQRTPEKIQTFLKIRSRKIQWNPVDELKGSSRTEGKDHQMWHGHPQSATRTWLDCFQQWRIKNWGKTCCSLKRRWWRSINSTCYQWR